MKPVSLKGVPMLPDGQMNGSSVEPSEPEPADPLPVPLPPPLPLAEELTVRPKALKLAVSSGRATSGALDGPTGEELPSPQAMTTATSVKQAAAMQIFPIPNEMIFRFIVFTSTPRQVLGRGAPVHLARTPRPPSRVLRTRRMGNAWFAKLN